MADIFNPEFWLDQWRENRKEDTYQVHKGFSTVGYWDKAAVDYNRNKEEIISRRLKKTVNCFRQKDLLFDGMTVLDIGCGTGDLSVELARHGARVTAVDFSEGMLDRFREQLPSDVTDRVTILHRDWHAMNIRELGWEKHFDLVLAFMSPAISTPESFFKMISLSRNGCAIRGWCARRKHPVLDALWEKIMNRPLADKPQSILYKINLLFSMGIFPDIWFDTVEWEQTVTIEQEFDNQKAFFEKISGLPEDTLDGIIREHLESIAGENMTIRKKHRGETATAIWQIL